MQNQNIQKFKSVTITHRNTHEYTPTHDTSMAQHKTNYLPPTLQHPQHCGQFQTQLPTPSPQSHAWPNTH